jgi:hypothetical protein
MSCINSDSFSFSWKSAYCRSFELLNKAFARRRDGYRCEYNDGNDNDVECELVCEHNEQFWNERWTGYKSRIIGGKVDS